MFTSSNSGSEQEEIVVDKRDVSPNILPPMPNRSPPPLSERDPPMTHGPSSSSTNASPRLWATLPPLWGPNAFPTANLLNEDQPPNALQKLQHDAECFAVQKISDDELKLRVSVSNSIDLALLLDNRFIEVNPEFLTVHWNPRDDDATVWFAIQTPALKCLDKDHQKLSFRMLDAHITLAYPSVAFFEVAGPRLVAIVDEWIVERQQRSANGRSLYGLLEWHENRMTHDRFTCLDIRYDMRDGLDY